MARIVQKFGGSSVANAERIFRVAKIITDAYAKGNEMCVVLSAQGDTTDDLIAKAEEINPNASKREMDMLLACGEQMSIALMAMAIEKTMTFFCVWLRSAAALARRLLGATRAVVARPATWRISCVVAAPPRCSSTSGSTGS